MTDYSRVEVEEWIDEIEEVLEDVSGDVINDPHLKELYDEISLHYDTAAETIEDEGLTDEACYDLEVAHKLLDSYEFNTYLKNDAQ